MTGLRAQQRVLEAKINKLTVSGLVGNKPPSGVVDLTPVVRVINLPQADLHPVITTAPKPSTSGVVSYEDLEDLFD